MEQLYKFCGRSYTEQEMVAEFCNTADKIIALLTAREQAKHFQALWSGVPREVRERVRGAAYDNK